MLVNFRRNSANSSSSNSFSASSCSSDEGESFVNKHQLVNTLNKKLNSGVKRNVHLSYSTPSDFRTGNKTFTFTKSDRDEFEILSQRTASSGGSEAQDENSQEFDKLLPSLPHYSSYANLFGIAKSSGSSNNSGGINMSAPGGGNKTAKIRCPKPGATTRAFKTVDTRIRAMVANCQADIQRLRNNDENFDVIESKPTVLLANLQKKLEHQIETLKNLQNSYDHHLKIREGLRKCALAHLKQKSAHFQDTMINIKNGFREANTILMEIEGRVEFLMGHIHMELQGIQGFSRLCNGDVYKVTIRHGNQKWRARGKILSGTTWAQNWDFPASTFKSLLGESLSIKVSEITNIFTKQLLLVDKVCDLGELNDHAMKMTLDLNTSGSLKMNLAVRWCPIHSEICTREFDAAGLLMGGGGGLITSMMPSLGKLSSGKKAPPPPPPAKKPPREKPKAFPPLIETRENIKEKDEGDFDSLESSGKSSEEPLESEEISDSNQASSSEEEETEIDIKEKVMTLQSLFSSAKIRSEKFGGNLEKLVDLIKAQKELFGGRSSSDEELLDHDEELSKCFEFLDMEDDEEPALLTGSANLDVCLETHMDICSALLNKIKTGSNVVKAKKALEIHGEVIGKILDNRSIIYDELEQIAPEFQHAWREITSQYCSSCDSILPIFAQILKSEALSQLLVTRIFDNSCGDLKGQIMTIFQFTAYIKEFVSWRELKEELILNNSVLDNLV